MKAWQNLLERRSMTKRETYDNMLWIDLINDVDHLTKISNEIWCEQTSKFGMKDYEYTGNLYLDYEALKDVELTTEPFHTQVKYGKGQTLHDGMVNNNDISRYEYPNDHWVHKKVQEYFKITKTQAYVNVQSPGNVCGVHIDKYRTHMTRGEYDFSNVLTKDIFSGIIFLDDWKVGQVFISGRHTITNWKKGDTYTFPWYMPHGSANAGSEMRHLIQFVGVNS